MARHGENIYKRKDGRYEGGYVVGKKINGKTRFGYVYGYQYAEVKKRLLIKKAAQANAAPDTNGSCQSSVAEWLLYWMENEVMGSVKNSSYQSYMNLINRYLLAGIGNIRLCSVTPGIVNDFVQSLEASGLSYSTIKSTYRLLSASMHFAIEEGKIQKTLAERFGFSGRSSRNSGY